MSSWVTGLLLLALSIPSLRAANGDDDDAIRDKRRGPWQSQTKENTVYLAYGKTGLRVPWGHRLIRDEASFGKDGSTVGPNRRWGSSRMTFAWQPADEDDMIQRQSPRAKIKRYYPLSFDILGRPLNYGFIKPGDREAPRITTVNKRATPMFSLRRLQSSLPTTTTLQNVPCDPTLFDANSIDCYD